MWLTRSQQESIHLYGNIKKRSESLPQQYYSNQLKFPADSLTQLVPSTYSRMYACTHTCMCNTRQINRSLFFHTLFLHFASFVPHSRSQIRWNSIEWMTSLWDRRFFFLLQRVKEEQSQQLIRHRLYI